MTPTGIEPMLVNQPSREFNDCSRRLFPLETDTSPGIIPAEGECIFGRPEYRKCVPLCQSNNTDDQRGTPISTEVPLGIYPNPSAPQACCQDRGETSKSAFPCRHGPGPVGRCSANAAQRRSFYGDVRQEGGSLEFVDRGDTGLPGRSVRLKPSRTSNSRPSIAACCGRKRSPPR
jgi:hypothetical protein